MKGAVGGQIGDDVYVCGGSSGMLLLLGGCADSNVTWGRKIGGMKSRLQKMEIQTCSSIREKIKYFLIRWCRLVDIF